MQTALYNCYHNLQDVISENNIIKNYSELGKYDHGADSYIRLLGIRREDLEDVANHIDYMQQVFYALYNAGKEVSLIYYYTGSELKVYIGIARAYEATLIKVLNGTCGIQSQKISKDEVYSDTSMSFQGFLRGNIKKRKENNNSLIDYIISGCHQDKFAIVVCAQPQEREVIQNNAKTFGEAVTACDGWITTNWSKNVDRNITYSGANQDYGILEYKDLLDKYYALSNQALVQGAWDVCAKLYTLNAEVAQAITGIITANCTDSSVLPEPLKLITVGSYVQKEIPFDDDMYECVNEKGGIKAATLNLGRSVNREGYSYNMSDNPWDYYKITNTYTSNEIAALVEFPHKDVFGFSVRENIAFDVDREEKHGVSLGNILYNGHITPKEYFIDQNELIRHGLVVGLTGSGKTNTIKSILMDLQEQPSPVPFLIIEPAKSEYWQMYNLGSKNITVYSMENKANYFCINPFECPKYNGKRTVSVQMHIDHLFAAFKASFIMYPPQPYILEQAIYAVYRDCGWSIEEDRNPYGEVYPTIEHLYHRIPKIVKDMGYDSRSKSDFTGALQARINALRVGQKGSILNVKKSTDIQKFFNESTVLELDGIGDDDVKAFIMSLVLIRLKEYRMHQDDSQKELKHILLIEEAHRLLKNVSSGTGEQADPRGNAVEFFCNLLAELRSKGQAFLVADQMPSKLAPDLVDNTNLKIVHRLVSERERSLMGNSMHMTEKQIDNISTFSQGVAAIYSEGDNRPKLVKARHVKNPSVVLSHQEVYDQCSDKGLLKASKNEMRYADKQGMCLVCPFASVCSFQKHTEVAALFWEDINKAYGIIAEKQKSDGECKIHEQELLEIIESVEVEIKRRYVHLGEREWRMQTSCLIRNLFANFKLSDKDYFLSLLKEFQ